MAEIPDTQFAEATDEQEELDSEEAELDSEEAELDSEATDVQEELNAVSSCESSFDKTDSIDSVDQAQVHLRIETKEDLEEYGCEIFERFIQDVDPTDSGLRDELYSEDILTGTDLESLDGKDVTTRKKEARQLFKILLSLPVETFRSKVFPLLLKRYRHFVILSRFVVIEGEGACLRCVLKNRCAPDVICDLLFQHKAINFDKYGELIDDTNKLPTEKRWEELFNAFKGSPDDSNTPQLVAGLAKLLHAYSIGPAPTNLTHLVRSGLPCTCSATTGKIRPTLGVSEWLDGSQYLGSDDAFQYLGSDDASQYLVSDYASQFLDVSDGAGVGFLSGLEDMLASQALAEDWEEIIILDEWRTSDTNWRPITGEDETDGWTSLHLACYYNRVDDVDKYVKIEAGEPKQETSQAEAIQDASSESQASTENNATLQSTQSLEAKSDQAQNQPEAPEKFKTIKYEYPPSNINTQTEDGETPLFVACAQGNELVVRKLLQYKDLIDVNLTDNQGRSPLDVAMEKRHLKVVRTLESFLSVTS